MSKYKDLLNQKFGKLTAKKFVGKNKQYDALWLCDCDCGNEKIVSAGKLQSGHTQSCGCFQRERTKEAHTKHSLYYNSEGKRSKLYHVWGSMKERCFNKNSKSYPDYGGRGVTICDEWLDYTNFHKWAIQNGYKEGLTIERDNNNLNYQPSNCRWIPKSDQSKNRSSVRYLEWNGVTRSVTEWSELTGIPSNVINQRIRRSWDINKSLTTKI